MKKGKLYLFLIISAAVLLYAGAMITMVLGSSGLSVPASSIILTALVVFLIWLVFKLLDKWYISSVPSNYQIGTDDTGVVPWWKSKLFWLGALQFIGALVNGLTGTDFVEDSFIQQILGLDWGNLYVAIMGLAVLLVRKYLTFFPVKKQ